MTRYMKCLGCGLTPAEANNFDCDQCRDNVMHEHLCIDGPHTWIVQRPPDPITGAETPF